MIRLRENESSCLVVVDGMSDFYRSYYKLGKVLNPKVGGFYGMIRSVFSYKKLAKRICIVWEGKSTIRKSMNTEYKANRGKMDDNFYEQLADVKKFFSHFIKQFQVHDYESDDLCATIAVKRKYEKNEKTIIVTGDDDMHQVIADGISVYHAIKDEMYTIEEPKYKELFPWQLLGQWSLEGDGSDNLFGIKRFLNKKLIVKEYFSKIYTTGLFYDQASIDAVTNEFVGNLLRDEKNIISKKNKEKIWNECNVIYKNLNLIALRKVEKQFYDKIQRDDITPESLIKKYECPSLDKYLLEKRIDD